MAASSPETKNYDKIRKSVVPKEDAKLISITKLPLIDSQELVVFWEIKDPKMQEQALELLDQFGSTDPVGSFTERHFVDDPYGSRQKIPGRYRVVSNRLSQKGQPEGIFQTLRLGYKTTLETSASIIKLGSATGNPSDGTYSFIQMWPNIAEDSIEGLTQTLNATKTVPSPRVQGNTVSGVYAVSEVQGVKIDDGSGIISRRLTLQNNITNAAALAALSNKELRINEILNLFGINTGEGDLWTFWVPNLNAAHRDTFFGLSDASLVSAFAAGWTYADRKWQKEPNGTATAVLFFRKTAWSNNWAGLRVMSERAGSGWGLNETRLSTGIPESGVAAAFTSAATPSDADTRIVSSRSQVERANGERAVSSIEHKVSILTSEASADVTEVDAGLGSARKRAVRVWRRRTETAKDTLITASTGKAVINFTWESINYVHSRHKVIDHPDGSYTIIQTGVQTTTKYIYFPNDDDGVLWVKEQVIRTSGGVEQYATVLMARHQKFFTSAQNAANYADDSDSVFTDHATQARSIKLGAVRYMGNGIWVGYQDKYTDPAPATWTIPAEA